MQGVGKVAWMVLGVGLLIRPQGLLSQTTCPDDDVPAPRSEQSASSPEQRALDFLAREVGRWTREHECRSCHNNGDAARTLFAAQRHGFSVDAAVLRDTIEFLGRPTVWQHNGPEGTFNDRKLARLQFAAALAAAPGADTAMPSRQLAAELLIADQQADGSWHLAGDDTLGSPITYGHYLATAMARQSLAALAPTLSGPSLARADHWLRHAQPRSVLDASAVLLVLPAAPADRPELAHCLDLIRRGQADDGGWGAYVNSPTECFDTALALLALSCHATAAGVRERIVRGRQFLLAEQQPDGSWPETTRPRDRESYAHRVSTTAWAALALLETRGK